MSEIRSKCIEAIAKVMEVEKNLINDETSPDTLTEWDSLAHVNLILELEKVFSISINPDQAIELENFSMICSFIETKV